MQVGFLEKEIFKRLFEYCFFFFPVKQRSNISAVPINQSNNKSENFENDPSSHIKHPKVNAMFPVKEVRKQ